MNVTAIFRYPVKSLLGERLTSAAVVADGIDGDRSWGLRDETTGRILTARREPALLHARATLSADDVPIIELPDGTTGHGASPATDAALSAWLGRPVRLVPAAGQHSAKAEYFADATDDASTAIEWTMPADRFVDAAPLLLLTTASLRHAAALHPGGQWDVARFRPNVLVDVDGEGWVEDQWCGHEVRVGSAALSPREPCIRCTMVTRTQPGVTRDLDIYRVLARNHDGTFGVWTDVMRAGSVAEGDAVNVT